MRYKLLGGSGLRVSECCLGTMTFGDSWGWGGGKDDCRAMYNAFREAGGNFVDTADLYTGGESERFVREFTATHRDEVVIATKFTNAASPTHANGAGNGRKTMVQALEASLRRLGTDRIDLYWVHAWDFTASPHEVMRGLDDLIRAGKVLYVGISDAPAWVVSRCNMLAELRGWSPFIGLQIEYNLVERTVERELIPMARALNLGVIAWSPLAGGTLTGKYLGKQGGGRREATGAKAPTDRERAIAKAVVDVAAEIGCDPGQAALAWLREKGVLPILGARKPEQLQSNLAYLRVELDDAQIMQLDEVSEVELGFPHDFLAQTSRIFTYGGHFDAIERLTDQGLGTYAPPLAMATRLVERAA